ncbi:hypothetical protein BDP81DRAFT_408910 [Colletotrichum phormii]|uniref:Uncharacterized protein n=1 Tax=Colletotrichum phormii TaxID=359342 RepID=A0AAJ0EB82_9PEZI|nr:uncharacterized protein BDP81DRAFT_408910 [Colletotrichum phormii]KAK1633337.1 hypothetical protein BDP81DRAFT_408910 [Colletotrichum phormii]
MQITSSLVYLLLAATASCQQDGSNREADSLGMTATQPSLITPLASASPSHVDENSKDIANASSPVIPIPVPTTCIISTGPAASMALFAPPSVAPPSVQRPPNGLPWLANKDDKDENTVWCISRSHYDVSYKPYNPWALVGQMEPRYRHKFVFPRLMKEAPANGEYEVIPRTYRITGDKWLPLFKDVRENTCMLIRARNFGEIRPDIYTRSYSMLAKIDDYTMLKMIKFKYTYKIEPLYNIYGEPHPNNWANQQDDRPLKPVKQKPIP